jgi:HKD family nuclease
MKSNQIVVSRPVGFDLCEALRCAKSVKLAMAFAKKSGWVLMKEALSSGKADVQIVVGLNFGITDPELLSEWLELSAKTPQFKVRVAPERPTFHPKLMIIECESVTCAIVGSGNLTGGGQLLNVECGVYISKDEEIKELNTWFNMLKSVPLIKKIIDEYRPVYRAFRKRQEESEVGSSGLTAALNPDGSGWYGDLFLEEMTLFLSTPEGKIALKGRIQGAEEVRASLRMPEFDFTKEGWLQFYGIPEFGRIRQTHPEMAGKISALRKALRLLGASPLDEEKFRAIYNRTGRFHVSGLGSNQITKVLTVLDRQRWPILNKRVSTTLSHYGYPVNWSAAGYLKFAEEMRETLKEAGQVDFWALDAFCEVKSRELDL